MWTPSLRTFRVLTLLSLIMHLIIIAEGQFGFLPKTADERTVMMANGINAAIDYEMGMKLYYLITAMFTLGLLGTYFLQNLGRWSVFLATLGTVFSAFAYGVWVETPAFVLLYSICIFLTNLTLAIAFLSPIALRFSGEYPDAAATNTADD